MMACFNTCVGLIACVGKYFHDLLPASPTLLLPPFLPLPVCCSRIWAGRDPAVSVPVLNALYPVAIVLIALSFVPGLEQRRRVYPLCIGCTAVQSIAAALPLAHFLLLPTLCRWRHWVLAGCSRLLPGCWQASF